MALADKLLNSKNLQSRGISILKDSKVYNRSEVKISSGVPIIDIAMSGEIGRSIVPGITMIAAPSKHFKSNIALMLASAYLKKYDDASVVFFDSEFGTDQKYWDSFGIDPSKVIHIPVSDIEELNFSAKEVIDNIEDGDHAIVVVDSIGNLASKKEVTNAEDMNSSQDMTRAKTLNSFFRIITPLLTIKNIPMIVINAVYDDINSMYPKKNIRGGCLEAGTMVVMNDGSLKAIEDIQIGDIVKTLEGGKEVTHTWDKTNLVNPTPECYEIEFEDGHKVVCSDVHKFLVNGEWVEAKDLKVGTDLEVANG